MTRINCVPPSTLTDKHLLAEYRELPRLAKVAGNKFAAQPNFCPPAHYTLGKGHVLFFVNKGIYLKNRFSQIVEEMIARGFKPNFTTYPDTHPEQWRQDWTPDEKAKAINTERINLRLKESAARQKLAGKGDSHGHL